MNAPVAPQPADSQDRIGTPTAPPAPRESQGPGAGGGAGTGRGTGIGEGEGTGLGDGSGGGTGGGPFRPGAGIEPPSLLREVKANYTDEARRRRIQGDVDLEIVVRRDGSVGDVRVLRGLGAGLNEKAIEAVRQWRFSPARRHGAAGRRDRHGVGRVQVEVTGNDHDDSRVDGGGDCHGRSDLRGRVAICERRAAPRRRARGAAPACRDDRELGRSSRSSRARASAHLEPSAPFEPVAAVPVESMFATETRPPAASSQSWIAVAAVVVVIALVAATVAARRIDAPEATEATQATEVATATERRKPRRQRLPRRSRFRSRRSRTRASAAAI